jgi:AAHS family 4-hydroxybenzoate transporter-like MFS transporter
MSVASIDVYEELAEAPVRSFHWRLCLMIGLLVFFDGYDTFNPAYVIHYVAQPWGLNQIQSGLLVSSGLVGFLLGAAIHGTIADRYGRRSTLLGGVWITSIFTLATALLAHSFLSFVTLRVLTGLGLGVLMPLGTTYINEFAPRRVTNRFTLWGVGLGWSMGGTAAGLVGVFVTPYFGWQSLYYAGSLSFILALALQFWLPESIKFLALHRRIPEIVKVLSLLRPARAEIYRNADIQIRPAETRTSIALLLADRYRRTTLTLWTSSCLSLFCIFGLSGWIPTVMMQRGETFAASFGFGALMQIMSFIGGMACGALSDRRGSSRGMLAMWWGLGGLSVWSLIFLNGHVTNFLFTAAAGFFTIGAQFVLNNFTAAAYETNVRATGLGMQLSVGRVGAILGPFIAGALQQIYQGPTAMFVAIGCASVVAGGAIASLNSPGRVANMAALEGSRA